MWIIFRVVDHGVKIYLHNVVIYNGTTARMPDHKNDSYEYRSLNASRRQPQCLPQMSLMFLKTHKSGSTTLIATFQKYAYLNKLLMMVPRTNNNMYNWPMEFRPNKDNMKSPTHTKFDMLVNHIIFNKTSINKLMKAQTKFVTILREPLFHLRSAFDYFNLNKNHRLGKGKAAMELFLSDPDEYDKLPFWMDNIVYFANNRINSMTRNLQSADLGLSYWDFDNEDIVQSFVKAVLDEFHFILILERLEESLVLFRRVMCWEMKDIMFIKKNVNPKHEYRVEDLSLQSRINAYKWNNVDLMLYREATSKLDQLLSEEPDIYDEIEVYRKLRHSITKYCVEGILYKHVKDPLVIPAGRWNTEIIVDSTYCALLLLDERDMTHVFKCLQYPWHTDCQGKSGARFQQIQDMIEGAQDFEEIPMSTRKPSPK